MEMFDLLHGAIHVVFLSKGQSLDLPLAQQASSH